MAKDDWLKLHSWSEEDKDNFLKQLNLSKSSYYKAQCLTIQANHLKEKHPESAIELCDIVINDCPEPSELSMIHYIKAECYLLLGKDDSAIESFRNSIDAMRKYPNSRNYAFLHFGYWVVTHNRIEFFDEILDLTLEFQDDITSPKDNYLIYGIHAIIHHHRKFIEQSKLESQKALENANLIYSDFRYHPSIGLVSEKEKETMFYKKLVEISAV